MSWKQTGEPYFFSVPHQEVPRERQGVGGKSRLYAGVRLGRINVFSRCQRPSVMQRLTRGGSFRNTWVKVFGCECVCGVVVEGRVVKSVFTPFSPPFSLHSPCFTVLYSIFYFITPFLKLSLVYFLFFFLSFLPLSYTLPSPCNPVFLLCPSLTSSLILHFSLPFFLPSLPAPSLSLHYLYAFSPPPRPSSLSCLHRRLPPLAPLF